MQHTCKIRLAKLAEVRDSTFVFYENNIWYLMKDSNGIILNGTTHGQGLLENPDEDKLRTVVVDYGLSDRGNVTPNHNIPVLTEAPLKIEQWRFALENGLIDSNREVDMKLEKVGSLDVAVISAYSTEILLWQGVMKVLDAYRPIVAPGCHEPLFISDFIVSQLKNKFEIKAK